MAENKNKLRSLFLCFNEANDAGGLVVDCKVNSPECIKLLFLNLILTIQL